MADDRILKDRQKALEETFFAKQNNALLERMRAEKAKRASHEALSETSGISDAAILDRLVELGISAETYAALAIVPLVEIAWADGKMEDKERRAVLAAAEANGVRSGSPAYQLLEGWLQRRPDGRLLGAWGEYTVSLCQELKADERHALRDEVLGRARAVAEAAGGFFGMGTKISTEEEVVLAELGKAFEH